MRTRIAAYNNDSNPGALDYISETDLTTLQTDQIYSQEDGQYGSRYATSVMFANVYRPGDNRKDDPYIRLETPQRRGFFSSPSGC